MSSPCRSRPRSRAISPIRRSTTEIPGGFAISDTAANISAGLDQLTDSTITSITISDNAPVGVTVAQISSDATAISKLANANS